MTDHPDISGLDPRLGELFVTFCKLVHLAAEIGAPPTAPVAEQEVLYNRYDAAKYACVSVATFDRARKSGLIKPAMIIKSHPQFSQTDLLALREKLRSK